jgi:hypothetical protein
LSNYPTAHFECKAHGQPTPAFWITQVTLFRIAGHSPPHSARDKLAALGGGRLRGACCRSWRSELPWHRALKVPTKSRQ